MTEHASRFIPSRRTILAAGAGLAAPMILRRNAWAAGKEIIVGIWGGAQGEFIRKQVIPAFEKDFGCTVLAEEGFTLPNIAKMRATKSNPKYTVMFVDDLAVPICKAEDLIAPLPADKMPNMAKLFPRFNYEDGYGTGLGISIGTMYYNVAEKPPTSFADLWDPRYKKAIKLNSWQNTSGLFFLIATAALVTGKPFAQAQYEVDKVWQKFAELKPNVQNVYTSAVEAANEIAQGQAVIGGIDYSKFIYPYTAKGAPIDMVFLKEGCFAGVNCQVLVKGGPNQDLGVAFMDRMLSPTVQKELAEFALVSPPVSGVDLSAQALKYVAYPDKRMDELNLFIPDWGYINKQRAAWTESANRIFSV
ncbi:extracellular solute-binding protein [uncultured Alsobacter sp.]|uniref:extracellular solute-binding protein n=1 Tax=uncultured Alsobacter sp. TaxID=1748258 RepID=UPI0025DB4FBA|nr:extracellular solute-binding protein [uncultured Alsobacter sp.]